MNGRKLRRNPYGAQRWQNIIIWILVFIVILMIAFLIAGNVLYQKSQELPNRTESSDERKPAVASTSPITMPTPKRTHGYAVDLSDMNATDLVKRLDEIRDAGGDAVAVNLTDENGKVLYRSAFAERVGYQSELACSLSVESLVSRIEAEGMYVTGYITLHSRKETDELYRSVLASYEVAIICEAFQYGVDEVVIRWDGEDKNLEELYRIAEDIHVLQKDAILGFSADASFFDSDRAEQQMEEICLHFDFLGMEIPQKWEEQSPYDYANSYVVNHLYYILRYRIRMILPDTGNAETADALLAVIADNDISGWQFIIS